MSLHLFTGIYPVEVTGPQIEFPFVFHNAVYPERTVILSIKDNRLIGYRVAIWGLLKGGLASLYDCPQVLPTVINDFLNQAVACRVAGHSEMAAEPTTVAVGQSDKGLAGNQRQKVANEPGTIAIPPALLEQVGIENLAIFVGLSQHFEIWSFKKWQKIKRLVPYKTLSKQELSKQKNLPDISA